MKLSEVKDLVINQGYAIHNDDTVEKLNEVFSYIKERKLDLKGFCKYYNSNCAFDIFEGNSINISEIELPNKITLEMVVDLTKKHTNDMMLGSELRKLLNN